MEHVIAVNCKHKLVSDGVEKFELRFVYEEFGNCVGDDGRDVHVKEVKELCSQPEGKNKRLPHKISAEKKGKM